MNDDSDDDPDDNDEHETMTVVAGRNVSNQTHLTIHTLMCDM